MRRRDFLTVGALAIAGCPKSGLAQPSQAEVQVLSGEVALRLEGKRNFRFVAEPGTVVRSVALIDCADINIADIAFVATSQVRGACLSIVRCQGVRVERCSFRGSETSFESQSRGVFVDQSDDIEIAGNTFGGLYRGAVVTHSRRIKVIGNRVRGNRSEGFNFAGVQHVEISRNLASDFYPTLGDHPDFIQFWTRGMTVPSLQIVITENVMRLGDGSGAQGIFMGNEDGIPYGNVRVERNLIESTYPRAISLALANDIVIRNNTVVQAKPGIGFKAQLRAENCSGEVSGNIANAITVTGTALARDNVVVRPDRYSDVFVDGDITRPRQNVGYRA